MVSLTPTRLLLFGGEHSITQPPMIQTTLELKADGSDWEERPELELAPDGNQQMNAIVYNV